MTPKPKQILVIAHRGAKGEAPENTLGAFRLGLAQGCDAIELDVHLSKDGEVVVCHDFTLDRTTDKTGFIHDMTVAELKRADAGRWFHESYEGERIPLMEEVFDLVPPGIMINIEMKHSYGRKLEQALVELIRRKDRLRDVVVSSFDHKSLLYLKLLEPEIRIGLLYDANVVSHSGLAALTGLPVYSLHPSYRRIDKEDVRDCVRQGLQVYPYTINDEGQMRQAIDAGVSGIITDFPGRLRQLLSGAGGQG
ncbi:glycerophosphodiester phosphodiesterase [Paenibacillus cisolokensis]|jgi:Glycerophosphoryl diester phosphodiesterase|uniref:glycerophosphodiester phosphodiesterase n=1 Tax=Paenibacillus TaxID=44249 RepID=UPI000722ECD7|nr:glycerophosphodiester phosphodiesterase [Paenibacillus sp. 32O-W]ALS29923.1 glycerophosphoryl diester phosphodiesterase [Paenibacillus sp. 32O-W]